ncbi:hypothetical protein G7054_g3547 [Neopestalotiopsis clavispora]|nr:hypothetical protein G7054_g3547 [Neopestalotiopsis clavispora]
MGTSITEYPQLLELLHDIVHDLTDHIQRRFQSQTGPNLVHREFRVQLDELKLCLYDCINQEVTVDEDLYTAAYKVAGGFKSVLHGIRIQNILRTEMLEARIAKEEIRQTDHNHQIVKNLPDGICKLLAGQCFNLVRVLCHRNPNMEMPPQAAKIPQPPKMRYSEKDFTTELSWFHCHEQLTHALIQGKRLSQPCQELIDAFRGWKLKIIATNITADATGDVDFITLMDPPEPTRWVTLQNVIDNQGIIFPLRERRFLAVILMYSFMQLLRGPWLVQQWGGADIYFNSESPTVVDLRRPYFSAYSMASQNRNAQNDGYHPMPEMVTLARYLLELELQDTPFSPNITKDRHSDYLKAHQLLREMKTLDKDCWAKALFLESMEACLQPETYAHHDDPNSRHLLWWKIYQKIVNPLEQNLLAILGPTATVKDLAAELSGAPSLIRAIYEPRPNKANATPAAERLTESDRWFKRLNNETHALLESVKGISKEQVRVAILDTGIDLEDPFLRSRISPEHCWDFVLDKRDILDKVGHGTHTASILAKTAPRARIYCGRVWEERSEDKKGGNTGELIAKAIEHAVNEWKAQIIVMPFAFPDLVEEIDDAIDNYHNKALLFAATSNNNDEEIGFPARLADVIGVYSSESHSSQSRFCKLGKEGEYNFSAIGEKVDGSWPRDLEGEDVSIPGRARQSGTSCSTPIAAGVAALILEFASLEGRVQVKRAAKLRKKTVMEKVLFECMTDKHVSGTYNLLQPWKLLSGLDGKTPRTLQSIAAAISTSIKESGG